MKASTIFGILLILLGVAAFTYHGVTYTTQESVADLGPLKVTKETAHTLPIPPIVGTVALLGGVALLVIGRKKS